LLWCSPFVYLYRRSLRTVHEYLADKVVLKTTRRKKYGHLLLRQSQSGLQIALANHFFQTQLKQRIMMMTRHKTSRKALIRYLLALPLLLFFLLAFANRELIGQTLLEIHQTDGTVLHKEVRDIKEADKLWSPDEIATLQILKEKDLNKIIVRMKGAVTDEEAPADRSSGETVTLSKPAKPEAGATVRIRTGDKDASTGPDRILIISPDGRTTELSSENLKVLSQFADPDNIVRVEVNREQGENVIKIYLKEALALPPDKGDAPPRFPVFKRVEVMPRFPGCEEMAGTDEEKKACADQKLLQFIYENIRYPEAAKEANIEGTVVVQFTIFADGTIGDSKVLRDIGGGAGEEALRAVKMMPDWTPGRQKGQAVAVQFNLPVRFKLSEEEKANAAAPPAIDRGLKLTTFSASPNPSAGILNLQFQAQAAPTQIRVTDLAGRELLRREIEDFDGAYEGQLDLSRAAKGTVLLIIQQGERIFTEKIVLQ
jgi:TonB family protein